MSAEGTVTANKKHPVKVKAKRCSHKMVSITWHPETGQEMTRRCSQTPGCGEQLSLGKTKGKSNAVELRAADLAAGVRSRKLERLGMLIHAVDCEGINDDCPVTAGKPNDLEAGWLCREIITHEGDRKIRDAHSYSWDTSRPIADQTVKMVDGTMRQNCPHVAPCVGLDAAVDEALLAGDPATMAREQCSRCGRQESPTCCDISPNLRGAKPEADLVGFDAKLTSLATAEAISSLIDAHGLEIELSRMTGEKLDKSRISDASLATIAHAPSRQPTAARIERALREIGCHHTPSPGWEDRVNATNAAATGRSDQDPMDE
jgi:hypothetical protein